MSDVEDVFEVEAIVGHRRRKGKMFFRIRWAGYTEDDDTWEEEGNLMCDDLVKQYLEKIQNKKEPETREFPAEEVRKNGHIFFPKNSGRRRPSFEDVSPGKMRYPLVEIADTITHDGEVFYLIKRKSLATEAVSSAAMRVQYSNEVTKFLEDRVFEEYGTSSNKL